MSIYSHNVKINRVKSEGKVIGKVYCHNLVKYDITGINPIQHRITVITNDSTIGTVSGGGVYNDGDTCTLTANYTDDYQFDGWYVNGNKVNSNDNYSFTVNSDLTVSAMFSDPYVGKVLYQNATGSSGTITFSESIANFAYIEFIGPMGLCKIIPGNYTGAIVFNYKYLQSRHLAEGSREHFYERDWQYTLTTTTLTPTVNTVGYEGQKVSYYDIKTNTPTTYDGVPSYSKNNNTIQIVISKVIGYKNIKASVLYNSSSYLPITLSESVSTNNYVLVIGTTPNDIYSSLCQYYNAFNLIGKRIFNSGGYYYCDEHQSVWTTNNTNNLSRSRFYLLRERATSNTATSTLHEYLYTSNANSTSEEVTSRPIKKVLKATSLSSHATILLDNPDIASSYTLSDSASNYDIIVIYYYNNVATTVSSSIRLKYVEGDLVSFFAAGQLPGSQFAQSIVSYTWINDTTLSVTNHPPAIIKGSEDYSERWATRTLHLECNNYMKSYSNIKIQKIVGYKGEYMF